MAAQTQAGVIYFQTAHYDDKQMQNLKSIWIKDPTHSPKILFGDHYSNKSRSKGASRMNITYKGQALIVGPYDQEFGFGIPTSFYYAKQNGFIDNSDNFEKMVQTEFNTLNQHLLNGNDIIIPYPTETDLNRTPERYHIKSTQIIYHNLGTGGAKLPMKYLTIIQSEIDKLKANASKSQIVKQKL